MFTSVKKSLVIFVLFVFYNIHFCLFVEAVESSKNVLSNPILKEKPFSFSLRDVAEKLISYTKTPYQDTFTQLDAQNLETYADYLYDTLQKLPNGFAVWLRKDSCLCSSTKMNSMYYGAYTQALGIRGLLAAYKVTQNKKYLDAAEQASAILFIPLSKGGILFEHDKNIWFESFIKLSKKIQCSSLAKVAHVHHLNGHIQVLLALRELDQASDSKIFIQWYQRGLQSLQDKLINYDTGYWLCCDNTVSSTFEIRLINPYGLEVQDIPFDTVVLRDPLSGSSIVLDIGQKNYLKGSTGIFSNGWGDRIKLDGRYVRRLKKVVSPSIQNSAAIRFTIPKAWQNFSRETPFELDFVYKDEQLTNISVQIRSIVPGVDYQDIRDGDLFFSNNSKWRTWTVPLRVSDIGHSIHNTSCLEETIQNLELLQSDASVINSWVYKSRAYVNMVNKLWKKACVKESDVKPFPKQTPPAYWGLTKEGVVSLIQRDGEDFFMSTMPFLVAQQALYGQSFYRRGLAHLPPLTEYVIKKYNDSLLTIKNIHKVNEDSAYQWIHDNKSFCSSTGASTWLYPCSNGYNDIYTPPLWPSAFSQPYIIMALQKAIDEGRTIPPIPYVQLLEEAIKAYSVPIEKGGLYASTPQGIFYEELPNATHVLNAHLVSTATLCNNIKGISESKKGMSSLLNSLYLYDTGYWLRYDANLKKQFLLNIDWIEGEKSPLIGEISIVNPATLTSTMIDTSHDNAFDGHMCLSGVDWMPCVVAKDKDGQVLGYGKHFQNGYSIRNVELSGGTRHNVYIRAVLPEQTVPDHFSWPLHILCIKYFDEAEGVFALKIQSIREGNVLSFVPLRNAIIQCTGEKVWKEANILLRPQDLGWYIGIDYQDYHSKQLHELVKITKNKFIVQYAEKLAYYRECFKTKVSPISFIEFIGNKNETDYKSFLSHH